MILGLFLGRFDIFNSDYNIACKYLLYYFVCVYITIDFYHSFILCKASKVMI